LDTFVRAEAANGVPTSTLARSRVHEAFGGAVGVELEGPEQRLARLRSEVTELQQLTEDASQNSSGKELLGADPASVLAELKLLEQRLSGIAQDGPPVWRAGQTATGKYTIPQTLSTRLDRLASGQETLSSAPGQMTYEINHAPSTAALVDSSRVAALEGTVAQIEHRLGVIPSDCPFRNLEDAVDQLQKRVTLLDTAKADAMGRRVHAIIGEVEALLSKKAELQGCRVGPDVDRQVNELYEFCHRWTATSASLPTIVSRLHSLQALHQQSASFASRLDSLEQQQEELTVLLDTTNQAVTELGLGMKENMTIVRDNMRSLEEKIGALALK